MKAIYFSVALLFFTVSAIAQTDIFDITVLPGLEKKSLIKENTQSIITGFTFPKYGIIKLPQDNMPCFVPDLSSIARMPTLKTVLPYQPIPNPYFNYNTSPSLPR